MFLLMVVSIKYCIFRNTLIVVWLLLFSCNQPNPEDSFRENIKKAQRLLVSNSDSVDMLLSKYQNARLNPYQKNYLNLLSLQNKKTDTKSYADLDALNVLLRSDFEDDPNASLRNAILQEITIQLDAKNPSSIQNSQTIDSLVNSYQNFPWFSDDFKGYLYIYSMDRILAKKTVTPQPELSIYLDSIKKIATKSLNQDLIFQYMDRNFLYQYGVQNRDSLTQFNIFIPLALQLHKQAQKLDKNEYYLISHKRLSDSYFKVKEYEQAIKWKYKELDNLAIEGNDKQIGISHNNLGVILQENAKYEEAIGHFKLAIKRLENIEANKEYLMRFNHNIGNNFILLNELDSATTYYQKVKTIVDKAENTYFKKIYHIISYTKLAEIASRQGDSMAADSLFLSILPELKYETAKYIRIDFYNSYAQHKLINNENKEAVIVAEEGLKHIFANRLIEKLDGLNILIQAHKNLGNYQKALQFTEEYSQLKQKYLAQEKIEKLANQKLKHKHEQQLATNQALYQKELQQKKVQMYISIIVVLILLFSLLYFFKINQNRKKLLELSIDKNTIISQQNQELNSMNERLNQFAAVLAHDIKLPIANISQYFGYIKDQYKDKINQEDQNIFNSINESTIKLNNMINAILGYSSNNIGVNKNERVSLKRVIVEVSNELSSQIKQNHATIQYVSNLPDVKANSILMDQLFLNLISNAIKFRNPDKKLEITISAKWYSEKQALISVADNGSGIPIERLDSIFEMYNSYAENNENESSGIGLAVCKMLIKEFGGEIWVESEQGKGSAFYFTLPVFSEEEILVEN